MHSHPAPDRKLAVWRASTLAAVFLVSCGYFYEGGGWNQNTRFDLVRAIVERHSVQIDTYQDNTGDKAVLDGHVYADKAPAASLTAVPLVWLVRSALQGMRIDVYAPPAITALSYAATLAAAGAPAALAGLCVWWLCLRFGGGAGGAAFAAIVAVLGTPLWAYGTLLYGHTLTAGCLTAAFLGAWRLGDPVPSTVGGSSWRGAWVVGLAAGWAVVTEFPASIPSALIVLYALWQGRRAGRGLLPLALRLAAGLSVGAAVLLTYNWVAFGSLFHIGYTSEAGFEGMRTGIFGVNWPSPRVAGLLLIGPYRGLLLLAPVLVAAPLGFVRLLRDASTRAAALVGLAIASYYFLLAAGYVYWDGGWSYGSRHLGPALPFMALGLAPVWRRAGRVVRAVLLVLAVVSVGESFVAVSTTAQPPGLSAGDPMRDTFSLSAASGHGFPMRDLLWPAFVSGDFPIGWQSVLERDAPGEPPIVLERRLVPRASFNLGQLVGLQGYASLVPLWLVWLAAAMFWRWTFTPAALAHRAGVPDGTTK